MKTNANASGAHQARFEIKPGGLPDMLCGNWNDVAKGVKRAQTLRPTYFTAQWSDGALKEARVWGPRVLNDGSLGQRELDYCWMKARDTHPIEYTDLPSPIANLLRSYAPENG